MKLLIVGASGELGKLIAARAIARGDRVTALARHPEHTHPGHDNLTLVTADLMTSSEALDRAVAGQDVVVSALGKGLGFRSGALMATATPTLIASMRNAGVKRLVFVSALGVPGTPYTAPVMARFFFRTLLSNIYADKAIAEVAVRGSGLDWTILAPVQLSNARGTGRHRMSDEWSGPWKMTRHDFADAVLRCVDDRGTIHQRLIVGPVVG